MLFWLISIVLCTIVCVIIFFVGRGITSDAQKHLKNEKSDETDRARPSSREYNSVNDAHNWQRVGVGIQIVAVILFLIWGGIHTANRSIHTVDYGNAGIIKTFGSISSIRTEAGLTLIAPWQDFEQENVQTQSLLSPDTCEDKDAAGTVIARYDNCFSTFSVDTNDVFIVGVLNFHIDPQNVKALRVNIGPNYKEKIVLPRVNQILKDETVKYKAVDIAPNRETIRAEVRTRLTEELAKDGIAVEDFLLQNVELKTEVKVAIELKVVADQQAQAAVRLIAVSEAQAKQVAATAQGAADKLRIEAQGQADANTTINASLTPLLIQFQTIQKLADKISVIMLPSNNSIISLPSNLIPTPAP